MLSKRAPLPRNSFGLRLDPFSLPARYSAPLAGAQAGDEANIYLDRDLVVVKRRLSGLPLTVSLPVSAFTGIAVRSTPLDEEGAVAVSIELLHRDPALSLPLVVADCYDEIVADWQAWSKTLGLPLMLIEADGSLTQPVAHIGRLRFDGSLSRRRSSNRRRRPRFLARRKTGLPERTGTRYAEREIIART